MSADPSGEQRTPFRDVQPHEVAADAGGDAAELMMMPHAKKRASPLGRKLSGASGADFDAAAIENFGAGHHAPFAAADEEAAMAQPAVPHIRHSESPKKPGGMMRPPPSADRRRRQSSLLRHGGMRSSLRHPLRQSLAEGAGLHHHQNLRASVSSAGGGELFTREVFDVHSEIDKLLGGLKTELDNWRSEFDSLQVYWFNRVMCVPEGESNLGVDPNPHDPCGNSSAVQLRSLYEFQCLLERHIEETEFDIQDLEERLKISEVDRFELQKLLEEGSQEVQDLEFKNADTQRELGKQTSALQTRIMQVERELVQCRKDMESRDKELDGLRKELVDSSEKVHGLESAASKSQMELNGTQSKLKLCEDQLQRVKGEKEALSEDSQEMHLRCEMLQSSLDLKQEEYKRVCDELTVKKEEKETHDVKHSKELKKVVQCLEQAKRELKQATVNEGSLAEELDDLKIQVESKDMELETVRAQLAEAKHSYEARISDLEAQALEGRNAVEMSLQKSHDAKMSQMRNEMRAQFAAREKELIDERNDALTALQDAHEKAVEAAAAEAASAAAAERARRFEFEEAQRGRTERAIRDAKQEIRRVVTQVLNDMVGPE